MNRKKKELLERLGSELEFVLDNLSFVSEFDLVTNQDIKHMREFKSYIDRKGDNLYIIILYANRLKEIRQKMEKYLEGKNL